MRLLSFIKTDAEKVRFTELLLEEFQKYGYGTLSKNELQDLLIYSINQASVDDFLSDYSNYELAKCLKITDNRIKSMRMNIAQKYDDINPKQQLEKLFKKIVDGKIVLTYDNENKEILIGLENNVEKRELETIAKKLGHTLNYKRNREITVINADLFLDIVEFLNSDQQNEIYAGIITNERELRKKNKQKEVKAKVKEEIGKFTKDIIIGIATNTIQANLR